MSDFFKILDDHHKAQLPFVIYHKPNAEQVFFHQMNTDKLFRINSFDDSGYVFAPFDLKEKAILFPQKDLESDYIDLSDIDLDELTFEKKEINENPNEKQVYLDLLELTLKEISEDENLDKIVTSRQINFHKKDLNVSLLFKRMLKAYPNAMTYIWFHPKVGLWAGATPETLIKLKRNQLQTMALAGTRHENVIESQPFTEKEKKEQAFVTEQILEALRQTKATDIQTSDLKVAPAGDLIHLLTEISAQIQLEDFDAVLKAMHPTPAVCGLPKAKSFQFLLNSENYPRQFYAGFLGELHWKSEKVRSNRQRNQENQVFKAIQKASDLYVNLRCLSYQENQISLYVGGGITAESQAEDEWEETQNKSQTMLKVL